LSDDHILNGPIWGSKYNSCNRQTIKHDGKLNSPMIFNISGSSVIYKECGNWEVHGLHGNEFDFDGYMIESFQLLQTQKEWMQSEIHRCPVQDRYACSSSGRRSFAFGEIKEVKQLGFGKTIINTGLC